MFWIEYLNLKMEEGLNNVFKKLFILFLVTSMSLGCVNANAFDDMNKNSGSYLVPMIGVSTGVGIVSLVIGGVSFYKSRNPKPSPTQYEPIIHPDAREIPDIARSVPMMQTLMTATPDEMNNLVNIIGNIINHESNIADGFLASDYMSHELKNRLSNYVLTDNKNGIIETLANIESNFNHYNVLEQRFVKLMRTTLRIRMSNLQNQIEDIVPRGRNVA